MKKLVIYYSYSGNTRRAAQAAAEQAQADLIEVVDKKRPNLFGAFLQCVSARGMKATAAQPLGVDLSAYDHITLMAPVWAGFPAPAINNVIDALPRGKAVSVRLVSGGGSSTCREQVTAKIRSMGCTVEDWEDIRA